MRYLLKILTLKDILKIEHYLNLHTTIIRSRYCLLYARNVVNGVHLFTINLKHYSNLYNAEYLYATSIMDIVNMMTFNTLVNLCALTILL